MPRKWSSQALADRITTVPQARTRIRKLNDMIDTHYYIIKKEKIMIMKHRKEIRLLMAKWLPEEQAPAPEDGELADNDEDNESAQENEQ
jgi:hypothetical protein